MSEFRLQTAVLAAMSLATPAMADLQGPAELPPPSYQGQQYVDSKGCVFLRAGYGGQVTWVPRVSRDRKQLCGYPKSGGTVEVAEAAPVAAPEPAPAPAAKAVAPAAAPKPAPVAKSAPAPEEMRPATATERAATAEVSGTKVALGEETGYRLACPAETPVAERFALRGGGSKLMCTTGDGSLDGANFPMLVSGDLEGVAVGQAAQSPAVLAAGTGSVTVRSEPATQSGALVMATPDPTPPPGYKLAWEDDRLNPNRGKQTVQGVVDQDRIWTRTVPAELRDVSKPAPPLTIVVRHVDGSQTAYDGIVVSTKGDGRRVVQLADGGGTVEIGPVGVTKSSKTEPKAVVKAAPKVEAVAKAVPAGQKIYVQVGSFGVAANAETAAGRLKSMGLKVARGKAKGGALQVIYAGPFASAGEAKAALSAARGAGFGDALIVQ